MGARRLIALVLFGAVGGMLVAVVWRPALLQSAKLRLLGRHTVADRVEEYGDAVEARLSPFMKAAGGSYPPDSMTLLAFKSERTLQVYGKWGNLDPVFIREYPVLGASGQIGPKLKEGDLQVPEGTYEVESLNPNSMFHLSLRLNFPNPFDLEQGARDGRRNLGKDIMIHGDTASIGCIAVGDAAAQDLFILSEAVGLPNVRVVVSPVDFRTSEIPTGQMPDVPWIPRLYQQIRSELSRLPSPPDASGR